ncbi:MAG: hypothetical protein FJZ10_05815 [Candidatus Omnitrophica bacterium]|nr:hypothetical protein [Candidatus Omnitrophota bacterium]
MPRRFIIYIIFIVACLLAAPFSIAEAEVSSVQSFSWNYYSVEGNENNSFYPSDESDYLYEGNFHYNNIFKGDNEFFGNIAYRSTDDKLIDSQSVSLENMYLGIKSKAGEFLTGDFYSSFSEYSLSNALKGLRLTLDAEKQSRLIILAGFDTAKWEDLWEERCDDSLNRRLVWGTRLENNLLSNKLALNFNYAGARDDSAYVTTPLMTNIFSLDGKYNVNSFLVFSSELAQSFVDQNIDQDDNNSKGDRAIKLACDLNLKDYNLTSKYSRVGTNFASASGFVASDLEAITLDGIWYLPSKLRLTHYLHMDEDNLSKTKSTTTEQLNPGARLDFSLFKDFSAFISTDFRKRVSTDKNTDDKTYSYSTGLTRDFEAFYSYLNYTKTIVTSDAISSRERNSDTYSVGLDGSFDLEKDLRLAWNISENLSYEKYKEAASSDFTSSTNTGIALRFPSSLSLEARASFFDNNFYLNDTDSNNTQYYFMVSRQLKKDLSFNLSYERRDYNFASNENNYAENITRASFYCKF